MADTESLESLRQEAHQMGLETWRNTPGSLESLVQRAYELGRQAVVAEITQPALVAHYDNLQQAVVRANGSKSEQTPSEITTTGVTDGAN